MNFGAHEHYCRKCDDVFICQKISHCKDGFEILCVDHRESLIKDRAEEDFLITGKRPGEA